MAIGTSSILNTGTAATASSAAALTGGTDAETEGVSQDRFLTLLVTQLKNQDPLNPLDNAQVTSQLAQISTVDGIGKLNTTVADMGTNLVAAQSVQAAAMIGRGVVAEGSKLEFDGTTAPITFDLADRAHSVIVEIIDPKTKGVVYSRTVENTDGSPIPAGRSVFDWDGSTGTAGQKAAAGVYDFKLKAVGINGTTVPLTAYGYAKVESVSLDDGVKVNTRALGTMPMSSVKDVL